MFCDREEILTELTKCCRELSIIDLIGFFIIEGDRTDIIRY